MIRPQFSIAPAEKSGTAAISCFGNGKGTWKNSSKCLETRGPRLMAYFN